MRSVPFLLGAAAFWLCAQANGQSSFVTSCYSASMPIGCALVGQLAGASAREDFAPNESRDICWNVNNVSITKVTHASCNHMADKRDVDMCERTPNWRCASNTDCGGGSFSNVEVTDSSDNGKYSARMCITYHNGPMRRTVLVGAVQAK
jgi:hypothetical protein